MLFSATAIFYLLSAIAIWLGLVSLRGGVRFIRYLRGELAKGIDDFTPPTTVVVPCRGVDPELKDNVMALFSQDYPSFELIFVSDRADDPAFAVIEDARNLFADASGPTMRFVVAEAA